jgi:hypothetical protein
MKFIRGKEFGILNVQNICSIYNVETRNSSHDYPKISFCMCNGDVHYYRVESEEMGGRLLNEIEQFLFRSIEGFNDCMDLNRVIKELEELNA